MSDQIPQNLDFCIDALRGAMALRGQALQTELAVGLYTYHVCGSNDLQAKKVLRSIYASAGEADCLTPGSDSYQTVNRRMDYIAALYEKIKPRIIKKWIAGKSNQEAIDGIIVGLQPFEFRAMDHVRVFAKKPAQQRSESPVAEKNEPVTDHPMRRASDQPEAPGTRHVRTDHIDVAIPPDATRDELMRLAMEILELAKQAANGAHIEPEKELEVA